MSKVIVEYEHDSADLQQIYLAVTNERLPSHDAWKPAYRDMVRMGDPPRPTKVVWAKFPERSGLFNVWVKDRSGVRLIDKRQV